MQYRYMMIAFILVGISGLFKRILVILYIYYTTLNIFQFYFLYNHVLNFQLIIK